MIKYLYILQAVILKIGFLIAILIHANSFSQDIEPRRWTSMPIGTNAVGFGYSHVFGNIDVDPVLQLEDGSVMVNSIAVQYVRPFRIGNRQARIDVQIPYSFAKWEGILNGEDREVSRNGFADPRIRLSLNFIGPKAMSPKEMQAFRKENPSYTTFGASIAVNLPIGQYDGDKLLNIGTNSVVIRPQIGMVHIWGTWSYELSTSVFFYTNNTDYYVNKTKEQNPLFAMQTHLTKEFKHRIWTTISFGYGLGGHSIVNRQSKNDERGNLLGGLSAGMPIYKKQSLKIGYGTTLTVKDIGATTNGFSVGWSSIF